MSPAQNFKSNPRAGCVLEACRFKLVHHDQTGFMEHHNSPDTIQQLINLIDSCPFTDVPALTVSQDKANAFWQDREHIYFPLFSRGWGCRQLEMCGSANLLFSFPSFPFGCAGRMTEASLQRGPGVRGPVFPLSTYLAFCFTKEQWIDLKEHAWGHLRHEKKRHRNLMLNIN